MRKLDFFSILQERCQEIDSLLCIGLDPHLADLEDPTPSGLKAFCLRIITSTYLYAAAFKPNIAFFEAFGPQGLSVLQEVIAAVPEGIPVIMDAKRGDIASTAQAYVQAIFRIYNASAVTCNPYLGYDSIEPFIEDAQKGVFLLCKTSNPGSSDLQDLPVQGLSGSITLYEMVARLATAWNKKNNLGLVVGATHPDAFMKVRQHAPDLWILAPGVGVQGGDLEAVLRAGLRSDGLGLLFPVSRQISQAADPGTAAHALRDQINHYRKQVLNERAQFYSSTAIIKPDNLEDLALALLEAGCVRFGKYQLKSGLQSPIYIDLRQLVGFPRLLTRVASAYLPILEKLSFHHLAAIPYAALPIGTVISQLRGWSMVYPRKEIKDYGTRAEVEGRYTVNERVVVIDDLATTGSSKFENIDRLRLAGLEVQDIVVLIDRQSGASEALMARGYRLHAVFTLTQLLGIWERTGKISSSQVNEVRDFIEKSK